MGPNFGVHKRLYKHAQHQLLRTPLTQVQYTDASYVRCHNKPCTLSASKSSHTPHPTWCGRARPHQRQVVLVDALTHMIWEDLTKKLKIKVGPES